MGEFIHHARTKLVVDGGLLPVYAMAYFLRELCSIGNIWEIIWNDHIYGTFPRLPYFQNERADGYPH